jgi:hypothetical protein
MKKMMLILVIFELMLSFSANGLSASGGSAIHFQLYADGLPECEQSKCEVNCNGGNDTTVCVWRCDYPCTGGV